MNGTDWNSKLQYPGKTWPSFKNSRFDSWLCHLLEECYLGLWNCKCLEILYGLQWYSCYWINILLSENYSCNVKHIKCFPMTQVNFFFMYMVRWYIQCSKSGSDKTNSVWKVNWNTVESIFVHFRLKIKADFSASAKILTAVGDKVSIINPLLTRMHWT